MPQARATAASVDHARLQGAGADPDRPPRRRDAAGEGLGLAAAPLGQRQLLAAAEALRLDARHLPRAGREQ
jgi:hypothetical protein